MFVGLAASAHESPNILYGSIEILPLFHVASFPLNSDAKIPDAWIGEVHMRMVAPGGCPVYFPHFAFLPIPLSQIAELFNVNFSRL